MTSWLPKVRVAACNVSPIFLNTPATLSKTTSLIREAAANRADLVVFPETYIPAFPIWAALAAPIDNHHFFTTLARESLLIDGPEIASLQQTCAHNRIFANIGFNERSKYSLGCIWNSYVLISDSGEILNHHRKIAPTFYEKLVWAPGDGFGLKVADTRIGKVGGLICGENTNPLARWSLMAQGEQVHVTSWPPIWPTKRVGGERREGEGKQYDLIGANRMRTAAHCFEAKCFGVLCSMFMDREMRDAVVKSIPSAAETIDGVQQAASLFLDPTGSQVGDQVVGEEGIAYADFDLNQCVEPKQMHDVVGTGYQRYDIFDVRVNRHRLGPENAFAPGSVSRPSNSSSATEEEDGSTSSAPPIHRTSGLRMM